VDARVRCVSALAAVICLAQCAPGGRVHSDLDRLRALHEKVIRAHRQSNVGLILEDEAPDYVVANRGEVTRPTLDERRQRLGAYLRSTAFQEYRDLTEPVVTISSDGTLGWVIVQVQASGLQTSEGGEKEPVEFVSAWVELYEKRDGRWMRVGNVSNFKP
jgi:hypothetical protein